MRRGEVGWGVGWELPDSVVGGSGFIGVFDVSLCEVFIYTCVICILVWFLYTCVRFYILVWFLYLYGFYILV